jgi:hypothetical protein
MKSNLRLLTIALAICVGFVALPKRASASTLMGDVISGSYRFPCTSCTDPGPWYSINPFVVTDGVESTLNVGSNQIFYSSWSVDFGPNTLLLTMVPAPFSSVSYTADPFNGPVFTVVSGYDFLAVTGVTANIPDCRPCTTPTAFVSGDSLFVNWQGAGGGIGDTILAAAWPLAARAQQDARMARVGRIAGFRTAPFARCAIAARRICRLEGLIESAAILMQMSVPLKRVELIRTGYSRA